MFREIMHSQRSE